MIFIGIDIAKSTHFASAVNSDGEVLVKPFSFSNNNEGFQKFINVFSKFKISDCIVGIESTGIYGNNLTAFLFEKGFKIGRINPIQTDSLRSSNIRKTKNDRIDTFLIAQCLMLKHYSLITKEDIQLIKLKCLCRFKLDVLHSQSKAKIRLVNCLDIAFPELASFFNGNLQLKSSYALLSRYPTAKIIAKVKTKTLCNILNTASRGRFKEDRAIILKKLAKSSISMDNPAIGTQIKMLIEQIQMLQKQIDLLDIDISNIMEQLDSTICSIPGIGTWLGAIIISEIGDISRFSSPKKLLAFAGLDPSVRQSGNFNATNTKLSKRGSKHLRYAIVRASQLIIWHDETFYKYYSMKLAQGKSYLNAIGHVSHKLTRIIFKLLKTNTTYSKS